MNQESFFMQRCIDLAKQAVGFVSPNPMVGALVLEEGTIIAEGYHERHGSIHAEIAALEKLQGHDLSRATLFCNLEPCSHKHDGKINPPCVPQIIRSGIKNVVIAMKDPNPLVSGKGIKALEASGINVICGVLKDEAEQLNEKYIVNQRRKRAFITLKIAQSLDGRIATKTGDSKWITSEESRKKVHQLRSEYDAILTTSNTVIADDPSLTVRHVKGRNPLRVILDRQLRIADSAKVFTDKESQTIVFSEKIKKNSNAVKFVALPKGNELKQFRFLMDYLVSKKRITSLLIECGQTFSSFLIKNNCIDEIIFMIAPKLIGSGIASISDLGIERISDAIEFDTLSTEILEKDIILKGRFKSCLLDS